MFVLEGFYDHIIDSDMDQGADSLCFLSEPVLQWRGVSQALLYDVIRHFLNPNEFPN